jgi:DNA excision repair protein ERCC-2
MVSDSIKKIFPYDLVRQSQEALIDDAIKALQDGKVLIAHAPTGLGKTASALAVAVDKALEKKKMVFFLTNRHTQHHIAIETLKLMRTQKGINVPVVDMIGKKWMCSQAVAQMFGNEFNEYCKTVVEKRECEYYNNVRENKKGLTVEAKAFLKELRNGGPLHNEEVINNCAGKKMCAYELSLGMAKDAVVLIGDYNYLFNPFVQSTILNKLEKEVEDIILVVDEGHNLPNRISEMLSTSLSSFMIKNAIQEAKKYNYGGLISWLQELMGILTTLADFPERDFEREKKIEKNNFMNLVKAKVDYDDLINELELAADEVRKKQQRSFLGGIVTFLESWKSDEEGYMRYIAEKQSKFGPQTSLHHACLDPSILSKDIFKRVDCGIIMSGTLKPTFMYKDVLGIERGVEKEYNSPFPPENKLTIIVPETSTKYSLRGDVMFGRISERCSTMINLIPGNVALFFPSYDVRDQISRKIASSKKMFWEKPEMSKEEKESFLDEFKKVKDVGGVLLGVSGANFAEGVDFPGDLLQGVVVVGVPLARPDLKTKEIINYYENRFGKGWDYGYTYPALNKCFQSAGRCIRSEKDRGVVIFLDDRFTQPNYFCCFPKERLIVTKEFEKHLRMFFGK